MSPSARYNVPFFWKTGYRKPDKPGKRFTWDTLMIPPYLFISFGNNNRVAKKTYENFNYHNLF